MRRWMLVAVLAVATGLLAFSASGMLSEHALAGESEAEHEAELAAAGTLYAAEGKTRAADTGTFSGSFSPPTTCGPDHPISVVAGTTTIDVTAAATVTTNDIVLTLHDPSGAQVASSDT